MFNINVGERLPFACFWTRRKRELPTRAVQKYVSFENRVDLTTYISMNLTICRGEWHHVAFTTPRCVYLLLNMNLTTRRGEWHHVAFTFNATRAVAYINATVATWQDFDRSRILGLPVDASKGSVRVCMYACMFVCMYVCMYVYTYVQDFDRSRILGLPIDASEGSLSVCMCVFVYVCMYVL